MVMNTRQRQSGSTGVFIVIGVVLAAAMIGLIVFVQKRNKQPEAQSPQVAVDQPSVEKQAAEETKRAEEQKKEADRKAADEKARKEAEQKREEEERTKRLAEQQQREKAEAEKQAAAQAQQQAAADGPMARPQTQHPSGLPTTGPVEDLLTMTIGAIAIIGAGYVYYHYGRN